jgi:Na+/proline symporter
MGITAAVYFALMVAAFVLTAFWGRRRTRTFDDYAVAGRAIGGLVNGMGGMASYLSAFLFMGMTGAVWKLGFPYMGILVPFALSIAMFMCLIGPYARSTGARTLIEFVEIRYGGAAAILAILINLLFVGMFMIGQMKAVGVCVEYITGVNYRTAVLAGGVVLTLYCVLGGMFGISWNQFIQGAIMLLGIAIPLAFVFRALGVSSWYNPFLGYHDLSPAMEARGFFDLGKDARYYVSLILPGLGGAAAAPQVFLIAARSKDVASSRYALSWMVFWIGLVYSCAMAFAFAATYWADTSQITVAPGQADYLLFRMCEATVPAWIGALVVAGALAASFSTTAALIAFVGTVSARYLYPPVKRLLVGRRAVEEKERMKVMAVAMGLGGLACILLAWYPPRLLVVPIIWGWELLTCTFFIPCLFACWWRRATRWGTLASMVVGCLVVLTQGWTGPLLQLPFYGSLIFLPAAVIANVVVSWLTPPDRASELVGGWHGLPASAAEAYSGKLLPAALAGLSVLMLAFALTGIR